MRGVLLLLLAVGALAALVVYLLEEGPDETRVGVVSRAEPHRPCVAIDDSDFCAHVDAPSAIEEIDEGDCVELKRSADGIFESARPSDRC